MNRGKMLILIMLAVGLTCGLVAWWHQYRQGVRVLQLWDAEVAYQIRMAPKCQLLRLSSQAPHDSGPSSVGRDELRIEDETWTVADRREIGQARGLVHARQALILDASYDWEASIDQKPVWTEALVFADADQNTTFLLDLQRGVIRNLQSGREGNISPIAAGLRLFIDEQWATRTQP